MYLLDLFWFLFFWWCFQVSAPILLECWLCPRQNVRAGFFCTWTCSSFSHKTLMPVGNQECWLCHGPHLLWSPFWTNSRLSIRCNGCIFCHFRALSFPNIRSRILTLNLFRIGCVFLSLFALSKYWCCAETLPRMLTLPRAKSTCHLSVPYWLHFCHFLHFLCQI